MSIGDDLRPHLGRIQTWSLFVAIGGLAASAVAGVLWPSAFFPAYLVGYLFWFGIALGSVSLLLLHNLTGGKWGLLIRRPLEAGAMTIVPMAVLFTPIALGLKVLYPWARPEVVAENPALQHKAGYLNPDAFLLRAGGYFAIWIALASLLHFGAIRPARNGGPTRAPWLAQLSGPGLAIVFLTATFASIDWGMSLDSTWYSSIYGVMLIVGWGLLTFSTMVVICGLLARSSPDYARTVTRSRIQDLGNLMLAFVMLWAYMSFSQFLIIWSGNLTEEIPWYLRRTRGGWQWVAIALIVFHFFVPFFCLLFRDIKRNVELLLIVALAIIGFHLLDLTWLVLPSRAATDPSGPHIPWGSVLLIPFTVAGHGGVSAWAFLWNLGRRPLVPDELAAAPLEHDE